MRPYVHVPSPLASRDLMMSDSGRTPILTGSSPSPGGGSAQDNASAARAVTTFPCSTCPSTQLIRPTKPATNGVAGRR